MRRQHIKYNGNGAPFVTFYKLKIMLSECMRIKDKNNVSCGVYTIATNISFLVYIDDDGEYARVKLAK